MAQQQNTNTANTNTTNPAHNAESKVDSRQDSALDSAQFATTDSTHSASSTHSTHSTHSARSTLHPRYKTKQIFVGNVAIGGDAPISVQSMTFTKTRDIQATKAQLDRLALAGADIVRVAVSDLKDAHALKELKKVSPLPLVSDIHFRY